MTIRQYQMLGQLAQKHGLTPDEALEFNQTTFGSVCFQRWVTFDATKQEFVLSRDGRDALSDNRNIDLHRKMNNHRFSVRVPQRTRNEANKIVSIYSGAA
jgi:hypothetical protein